MIFAVDVIEQDYTADGNYKVCLFDNREISLRDAIRQVV